MAKKQIIGLLGGGQLGRMLCEAAAPLGETVEIAVLDAEHCPAKQINDSALHVTGSFKDPEKIKQLAARVDVLTVEIEHIDTVVLEEIATKGVEVSDGNGKTLLKKIPVHPSWKTLRLIQDKFQQKEYFSQKGIPVAEQIAIKDGPERKASLQDAATKFGFPFMVKGCKDSYDGRGNFKVGSAEDLETAESQMGEQPLYAEKWVPFVMELAAMVIRTESDGGELTSVLPYPVVETIHEDSICTKVFFPPRDVADDVIQRAQKVASDVVASLWGRGVFAVEMFLLSDGQILVNEVAPRPHNSGHYTIEAVPQLSQYKAQLLSILDRLPGSLKPTPRVPSAIMVNILGGAQPTSHDRLVELAETSSGEFMDAYLHLYGKQSKSGRKIGHVTTVGYASIGRLEELTKPIIACAAEIRAERVGETAPAATVSKRGVPLVAVTMGSDSDLTTMSAGLKILDQFEVPYVVRITSAHRTPEHMSAFAKEASKGGIKVIIAGAGGAAHLPGMLSSETHLPVIGVPVKASVLDGVDSLHSIIQMPRGIPCATVGIGNSTNAALLAVRILGTAYPEYAQRMKAYQEKMKVEVLEKDARLVEIGWKEYLEGKKQ